MNDIAQEYSDIITNILDTIKTDHPHRALMYSDLIDYILREGLVGESYNRIISWCNHNITKGIIFFEI
jgi:hypothetical protein